MQRLLVCAIALLTLAAPAAAQEQRGSIVGTIKDSSGAVLPGVSVTASGPAMPAGQTTVTDANGSYQFPALLPGVYTIKAELQGFQPAQNERRGRERRVRDERQRCRKIFTPDELDAACQPGGRRRTGIRQQPVLRRSGRKRRVTRRGDPRRSRGRPVRRGTILRPRAISSRNRNHHARHHEQRQLTGHCTLPNSELSPSASVLTSS